MLQEADDKVKPGRGDIHNKELEDFVNFYHQNPGEYM